jgi:pimeloyl-ACP methyl ester carboxylesterase
MKTYFLILILGSSLSIQIVQSQVGTNSNIKLITYKTEDCGTIEASFFKGGKDKAVIFAHGAIFNYDSWYFLAEKFHGKGVTSLSIDLRGYGKSINGTTNNMAFDILGAIDYLKGQGFKNISLVGGSMGGAAILDALEIKTDDSLKKVVLLSPAGSNGITSNALEKLLVVSEDEGFFARVKTAYDTSSHPKQLKIYEGSYHAQHLFKSSYADELTDLIIEFIIN